MSKSRLPVLALLLLTVFALFTINLSLHAQTKRTRGASHDTRYPNLILIVADDLGYGDLGCYGQTKIKTPNIDQLAADGMRFTDFYAGSPFGDASRAALMTGLDTGHSPIRSDSSGPFIIPLPKDDVTLATWLHQGGYYNGVIGKWSLGNRYSTGVPLLQGFQDWFGFLTDAAAENYFPTTLNRANKDRDLDMPITNNFEGNYGKYADDYFTQAGINFMDEHMPDWFNHFRTFFLYLPYTIPHANNNFAAGAGNGNGMQVPYDAHDIYISEDWPQPEKNKASMITRMDRYVGTIVKYLKDYQMYSNTVIVFTSANGPHHEGGVDPAFFQSSGPFRGIKHELYEGGIRVPFIVKWPAKVKPGTTSDLPAALWDFLNTAAEMSGQAAPGGNQGISFLPTLCGEAQTNSHTFLYWEIHEPVFKQAVRMGNWKALRSGIDGPFELYDLKSDAGEKTNVAGGHPDVIASITQFLKTARTEDKNWPVAPAEKEK